MRRQWFIFSILVIGLLSAVVTVSVFDGGERSPSSKPPRVASEPPTVGDTAGATDAAAPSGEAMPVGDLPGWRQTFTDDFTTPVPLGSFPTAVATKWAAYPSPWKDTSQYGTNTPLKVDSIANGVLTQHIHTENGVPMVSALQPKVTPTSPYGSLYGRYAVRFRADPLAGYKVAWLLWPDQENHLVNGEIDFPETNLVASSMWAFVHRTNATAGDDQASWNPSANLSEWHTAVISWSPDQVRFDLDGVELGRTSERIPTTPMHWVLQTETSSGMSAPPDPAVAGDVQIDWVAAWAYDPTTADTEDPVVMVTAPSAGATVSGSAVSVPATATDNKGVVGVQFQIDGEDLGPEVTTAPYSAVFNTMLVPNGPHTLTAIGRDDAGNQGTSAAVTVQVNNVADTTPPTFTSTPCLSGCTDFPTDQANVLVSFNEQVVGVSGTSFTLKNQSTGVAVSSAVSYESTLTTAIATLDPLEVLLPNTRYTATLTSGITDVSNNPMPTTSWTFATGPGPSVTATTPANAATAVSRTAAVTATFNVAVTGTGGKFTLKTSSGTLVPATTTYDPATLTATLTPSAPLAANTQYTAALTADVKDAVYNALDPTSWTFTTNSGSVTADTTAPLFTTIPCQAGCTDFPITGAQLQATFNEQVTGVGSATFWMKNTNTGQIVPGAVSYATTTAIASFSPSSALLPNTRYTATLTSGITDVSNNAITTTSWTFATGPGPSVTATTPANAATAVSRTAAVTATFNVAVTGTGGKFTLKTSSGTLVPATTTYDPATLTATLTPSAPLAATTQYTAALTADVKDAVYNALDPTSWTFTTNSGSVTADTTAPLFTTIPCQAGCTDFPITGAQLQATFNEQVTGVGSATFWMKNTNTGQIVPGAVSYATTTAIASFSPSSALLPNTRYTATLTSGITDVSNNAITTTSWTFATGPGPSVTATTPANAATAVSRTAVVTATFDVAITGVSGNFKLSTLSGTQISAVVTYNAATRTATLDPVADLLPGATYRATLTNAIKDAVYNSIDPVSWTFTIGP